ncbi:MAG: hypothetical protein AABY10_06405, partial [Nanoarchaeota archaeon]
TANYIELTKHYKTVINRPVKWIKQVKFGDNENSSTMNVELPKEANNITVKTGSEADLALAELDSYDQLIENIDREVIVNGGITGFASLDLDNNKGVLTRLWNWFLNFFTKGGITGRAVQIESDSSLNISETQEGKFIDVSSLLTDANESEIVVEYYTDGPIAKEETTNRGKIVKVSGSSELNFTDILSYAELPEIVNTGTENKIKIFWREENKYVNFTALDLDENGKIDYVEWIVPHLSEQTFEIILISKAEHLDENKTLISDIYDMVRELDGNWSETIKNGEYVRVVFQQNLTSKNDITLYPRTISGEPRIKVFEYNKTELVTEFVSLKNNEYNKVYLNNLQSSQDTFDLQIINGEVEFDYIVDPITTSGAIFNATAGDGHVLRDTGAVGTWRNAHDTANGTARNWTATTMTVMSNEADLINNEFFIYRLFIPVNTTNIPDNATVDSATFHFYVTAVNNGDNDGEDFIVLVGPTNQSSTSTLITDDYNKIGNLTNATEISDRIDVTSISTGTWQKFTLNSAGRALVNKTGLTLLGMREGHDQLNISIASNVNNQLSIITNEGGTNVSYLNITYFVNSTPYTGLNAPANSGQGLFNPMFFFMASTTKN